MAKIKNDPSVVERYESTLDYMRTASVPALQEIELRRLAEAADLRQTLTATITELVRVSSEALHARALRKMKQEQPKALAESAALAPELIAEAIAEPQSAPRSSRRKKLSA